MLAYLYKIFPIIKGAYLYEIIERRTAMNEATKTSRQQELHRLLLWMRDNPEDWDRICHPETYETDMDYIVTMVDSLYQHGLYTIMMQLMYANYFTGRMEQAITRTTDECFLDMPEEVLMERFRRNLQAVG